MSNLVYKLNRRLLVFWRIRDFFSRLRSLKTTREQAIQLAMNWLIQAQDVRPGGGYSAGFDLRSGWLDDFPETTGYIIPTFYDYFHLTADSTFKERAIRALDWLLEVQNEDGSISGFVEGAQRPIVYDTGQVLFGLVRGYQETGEQKYLNAATKAGDWLCDIMDSDGKWSKHTYCNLVHTYNTRVAWSLLELYQINPDEKYRNAAEKNIEWAIGQQNETGWYAQNIFEPGGVVYTHATSYATRGILECGLALQNDRFIKQAQLAADAMLEKFSNGKLPGVLNLNWVPATNAVCLTGQAQAVIIWLKLFEYTNDRKYWRASKEALDFLVRTQERSFVFKAIHGAIKGSDPITGPYLTYSYPNWAPKFFVDALLLEQGILQKEQSEGERDDG